MNQVSPKYKIALLVFKVLIGILTISTSIRFIGDIYFEWQLFRDPENGILSFISNGFIYSDLRAIIILIVPIIGISINKPVGWFLIQLFLYFLLIAALYRVLYTITNHDIENSLPYTIASAVLIPFVIFLNLKPIREVIYGIKPSKMLLFNIGATVIGILITLILI